MIPVFRNSHKVVLLITMSVSTLARNPINVVTVMHRSSQRCLVKAHAVVCDTSMLLFSCILRNLDSTSVIIYLLKSYFARLQLNEPVVLGCILV